MTAPTLPTTPTPPTGPAPTPDPATIPTPDPGTRPTVPTFPTAPAPGAVPGPSRAPTPAAPQAPTDLTFDDILQRGAVQRERVYVEALDGFIWVESISAAANEAIEAEAVRFVDGEQIIDTRRYKISKVMCGWVGPDGTRLFQGDPGRERIGKLRSAVVDEVFKVVQRISGQSEDADEAIQGNLPGARSASGS